MNRSNFRALAAALALSVLGCSTAYAGRVGDAVSSLFRRGANAVGATACTVVAGPVSASDASRETDVLCLDTSIQMQLVWIRFGAGDRVKVDRKVALGATVIVRNSSGLVVDGHSVLQATRWEAKKEGNPARRDFLVMDEARLPLLAWSLRGHPEIARHFGLSFAPVAAELHQVYELLDDLGHVVPGFEAEPAATLAPAAHSLSCRSVLRTARSALVAFAPVGESIAKTGGPDHHGEFSALRGAADAVLDIDDYFDTFPAGE